MPGPVKETSVTMLKAAGAVVLILGFVVLLLVFMRKGVGRLLLVFGATSLGLAALTHVCEALHLFPAMGWGLPRSPGHYLDLDSTLMGLALLTAGFLVAVRRRTASVGRGL
jgi:hypothetical protein